MVRFAFALRRLAAALVAVLAVGMAHEAAAQGGVQADTATFSTYFPSLCVLGSTCGSAQLLGFNFKLGNGTVVNSVYVYREGVISFGSALPTGATIGDLNSLGGAYYAGAFSPFTGDDVTVTFGLAGGIDHGLPKGVNDQVRIDYFVEPTGFGLGPDPTNVRGEFQIQVNRGADDGTGATVTFLTGGPANDTSPGARGTTWYSSGIPAGALSGANLSGVAVSTGTPEPASWTLMIGGFAAVGGLMRHKRRRPVLV
jgi:hypothetical protein